MKYIVKDRPQIGLVDDPVVDWIQHHFAVLGDSLGMGDDLEVTVTVLVRI